MNYHEKEEVIRVINYIWGQGTATQHNVSTRAAEVAYEALVKVQSCSASMDIVPRPAGGKPAIGYIVKQLVGVGKRIKAGDTNIYYICKKTVALSNRTAIYLALHAG